MKMRKGLLRCGIAGGQWSGERDRATAGTVAMCSPDLTKKARALYGVKP